MPRSHVLRRSSRGLIVVLLGLLVAGYGVVRSSLWTSGYSDSAVSVLILALVFGAALALMGVMVLGKLRERD